MYIQALIAALASTLVEEQLRSLFPAFPGRGPGIALLLLRTVLCAALLQKGYPCLLATGATTVMFLMGLLTLAAGLLLLAGFLTPIVTTLVGFGAIGTGTAILPDCAGPLLDSKLAVAFAAATLLSILLLGPGAYSIDAKVFGRREIFIPRTPAK